MYVKYCGFTQKEDVKAAVAQDVNAIGFITYPKSARYVSIDQVQQLSKDIPDSIDRVAVVVNSTFEVIQQLLTETDINTIQFHGDETPQFIQSVREHFPKIRVVRALPGDETLMQRIKDYQNVVDQFIIDTPSIAYGGTGHTFDWRYLKEMPNVPFLIAGGINTETLPELLRTYPELQGVDVASGIESRKGIKNEQKMKEIMHILKGDYHMSNIQLEVDQNGFFGDFGGRYIPETLMPAIQDLKQAYNEAKNDPEFIETYQYYLKHYVGRESPLTYADSYTKALGGAKIYLKREDLNHTGAHKINNALGQALLAKRMGKRKLVAETGAGQHGVASATVAALFDMELIVFMGEEDIRRQQLNVFRMELLGAKVVSVTDGQGTLSDAVNKALQYWVAHVEDTHYLLGSALGPDPFPTMVRDFQRVIGDEIKSQILEKESRLPDAVVACVGGGSNAIGTFYPFVEDSDVKLYGVEAAGQGANTNRHALAINKGKVGILHGTKMYLIQNDQDQIELAHSISAGLDYPGVGPEHSYYHDIGRVKYETATDTEAMEALIRFSKLEGIIPAIESAHALSYVEKLAPTMDKDDIIVVTVSGRGDKDMETIREYTQNRGGETDA
ncbi:tryptophan synthase subunit beta [Staphylococcus sp. H16/1A]|uniref:Multifunctional fusion protein n=2 Tax=Staphylococcus canis TaxID=2724942 RepID=A0ABS0T6K2_9STAP|nr:tryptophan synthase subunit beta [Staphylococcus canis]